MERREDDHSMFETTHMLGTHLASSPLLAQAWRQCAVADSAAAASFVVEQVGGVNYVAFSGVRTVSSMANGGGFFCGVPVGDGGVFSSLAGIEEDGELVLVHAVSLHLFISMYQTPEFKMLLAESKDKALIFTGHSIGGAIASLATLCLLCSSQTSHLLCITFGSPLLGNESLRRAILRERWGGKFCHVVSRHDVVPRLLFCPPNSIPPRLITHLLQSWQFSIRFPHFGTPLAQLSYEEKTQLCHFISRHMEAAATEQRLPASAHQQSSLYRPFGSYLFCSTRGAVCIDDPFAVVQMLYSTFVTGFANSGIEEDEDRLSYGDLVVGIAEQTLLKGSASQEWLPRSSHDAGISLALEASGIQNQDMVAREAEECLKTASAIGRIPSLNCANLAIKLAKVTPCRAQIEWYKSSCDDGTGYYDAFKHRKASKREAKVNMNRIRLANFWDNLLDMLQQNQLPHDFHKRAKWVNAAQFYMLLVEPLDIAEYYRNQRHKTNGHYLTRGRERRYRVFDGWWRDRHGRNESVGDDASWKIRSKFAGLTQDPCFWAKVEEARELAGIARSERDPRNLAGAWEGLNWFDCYARQLVERKEVSVDVLAPSSSYSLWVEEWKQLKSELK